MVEYASYSAAKHTLPEGFKQLLNRSLCVAVEHGKVVGCIAFDAGTGEILHVEVDPAFQGQHIGRHLIDYIGERVMVPMLKAQVLASCLPFFESCGFLCEKGEGEKYTCYRVKQTKRCC